MNRIFTFFLIITAILVFSIVPDYSDAVADEDSGMIKGSVTGKSSKHLRNTVVYIEKIEGDFPPQEEHAIVDQKELVFIPHVLVITKGTTVDFLNSDEVRHNVFSPDDVADKMNLGTWPRGEVKPYTFNKLGVAAMLCNVHPEMESYVVVLQNPYFAIADKKGNFEIENVPPGEYTLKVWNKKYKAKDKKVNIGKGKTSSVDFKLKR